MTDPIGGDAPTGPSGITVSLDIMRATWGDLRKFVALFPEIPDECELGVEWDSGEMFPTGLRETLGRY